MLKPLAMPEDTFTSLIRRGHAPSPIRTWLDNLTSFQVIPLELLRWESQVGSGLLYKTGLSTDGRFRLQLDKF